MSDRPNSIVIVGAGGHGSELASYMHDLQKSGVDVELIGFADDNAALKSFCGVDVIGTIHQLSTFAKKDPRPVGYITAFGSNSLRRDVVTRIEAFGARNVVAWTLQHPRTLYGSDVEIGEGTCLAPGSIVTTRVRIGKHCILNVNASVSHDCKIGDFVNINPGATICGDVVIGDGSFIGAGAVVKEKITIGQGVLVGAGAVVVKDVSDGVKVIGVPARVISKSPVAW